VRQPAGLNRQFVVFLRALFISAAFLFYPRSSQAASPLSVVINEIAWGGTAAGSNDEWIELVSNSSFDICLNGWALRSNDGTPSIVLAGTIPAAGYYLLERSSDAKVSDIPADRIFTGAIANGPPAEDFFFRTRAPTPSTRSFSPPRAGPSARARRIIGPWSGATLWSPEACPRIGGATTASRATAMTPTAIP